MGVLDILEDLGGCAGGQRIYQLANAAMEARHPRRERRRLQTATVRRLQHLYPDVDLSSVRFVTSADLTLQELFEEEAAAITFGATMWFKHKRRHMEETEAGLLLLMHELVHVAQYRRLGSSKTAFACAYGMGYLEGGGYESNPMEQEAYDFVDFHDLPPPDVQPVPAPGSWLQPVLHAMLPSGAAEPAPTTWLVPVMHVMQDSGP
jgi:hypothetical protein